MTTSAVPVRSTRIRILAVVGALALGLGLVPAQAAFAAPGDPGTIGGVVTASGSGAPVFGASVFPLDRRRHHRQLRLNFLRRKLLVVRHRRSAPIGCRSQPLASRHVVGERRRADRAAPSTSRSISRSLSPIPTGDGTVTGTISNKVTGAGIPGVEVSLQADDFSTNVWATTDADGAYAFTEVAPGGYSVNVYTFGLPYRLEVFGLHVTITEDEPDQVMDVELTPYASGTSLLTGLITDAQSRHADRRRIRQPLRRTLRRVFRKHHHSPSGAYSIADLAARAVYLFVSVWAGGYLLASANLVDLRRGNCDLGCRPDPPQCGHRGSRHRPRREMEFHTSGSGPTVFRTVAVAA